MAAGDNAAIRANFSYQPTMTGFVVIDDDSGHQVTQEFDTAKSANGVAQTLNRVARTGDRRAFARALRSSIPSEAM